MDVQVDDRPVSERGKRIRVDGSRREEISCGVVRNCRDHRVDDVGAVVEDDPQPAELPLDRAHGRAEDDPRSGLLEHRGGRVAVQLLQRHRRDADVARPRRVEEPGAEHLNRLRERRFVGRDVHRRQRDQVPQRRNRPGRLLVGPQPVAERHEIELRIVGIETSERGRCAHGGNPLAEPKRRVAKERRTEMERRRQVHPS